MNISDKQRAFEALRNAGIVKVIVQFSGGNDEGGADRITGYRPDGTEVDLMTTDAYHDRFTQYSGTSVVEVDNGWFVHESGQRRPATPAEVEAGKLVELLEAPVYEEYYSFAGDFYVNGAVTWDVQTGKVTMSRNEDVPTYSELEF